MKSLNTLLNTGKTPALSTREERQLKFCNATVLIVLSFIVANLISLLAYGAYNSPFALIPVSHFILIAASLFFNAQKKYLIAKMNFSVVAVVFVSVYAIAYGKEGQNFLFLPMIAFLVFNLFAPEEKQYMWMMLVFASLAYLFVLYANQSGFESWFGLDSAFREIQGKVALAGNLLLTLSFGMYNFILIGSAENKLSAEHQVVVSQKRIIEKAHWEITDSIRYARRIQHAIMPSEASIKSHLQNSFVLYLPKNVVAGDFYWLASAGSKVLFAVGDCTGHGVPGAMLSLICHNGLNRSVQEYNLNEPGAVLEKTRDLIIGEFEKSELEVKDGMDIALCKLDGTSLSYAGANNPLWIIRKGEILEIKADRQPIGKFDFSGNFTTKNISLQEGDSLYLFTDGFTDQLGGAENKRFTRNRLKLFLLAIQNNTMQEQHDLLLAELERWKGGSAQTDDVCILGVKI
jgi:serine phosphatase RsbU (regulator of sigma subunit)